jgi:hypothetical protein
MSHALHGPDEASERRKKHGQIADDEDDTVHTRITHRTIGRINEELARQFCRII